MTSEPRPGWRSKVRQRADEVAPEGTEQRKVLRLALHTLRHTRDAASALPELWWRDLVSYATPFGYRAWERVNATGDDELADMAAAVGDRSTAVTAVVVPGGGDADESRRSLQEQVHPAEVVDLSGLAADAAWSRVAEVLHAAGEDVFVIVVPAGDGLERDAVARVVDRADAAPQVDVVSWDDVCVGVDGRAEPDPRFRPVTWSPDALLSANTYGTSLAIRAGAARRAGGLRTEFGAAATWDLLLRMALTEQRVAHVPRVLGRLAVRPQPVGPHGARIVSDHLGRLGLSGEVRAGTDALHIRWAPSARPRVSLLVPTRHNRPLIGPLIDSLARTEYPDWELVVVDNGGRTADNEAFYEERASGIDHRVLWWDEPFNYGSVNNAAARAASGEVLVLLNDDTVIHSPGWLDELVGWLDVPGVGSVGVQMIDPDGRIQHGGAIIGAAGLADHRFQGMAPHSRTILGSTDWYWDSSANTGACVAVRRELWDDIGGLDERFTLCGSDVVLGLELRRRGLRNVCTPAIHVDHLESATRKTSVPVGDVFASYWPYARHLRAGDQYHNPNVSLLDRTPSLRAPDEPTALERVGPALGRGFGGAFVQSASGEEAREFAAECTSDDETEAAVRGLHDQHRDAFDLHSVNWFVPSFDNPFYGGLATIFRIADHLRRRHGVQNRFVVWRDDNDRWIRSGLAAVFPGLEDSEIVTCDGLAPEDVAGLPPADVAIATQWQTAFQVAHFPHARRKLYLIQDFEPMFNPAGTLYALAEETYRLGLLGLCNTPHLLELYQDRYGGTGTAFTPAVDPAVFHARGRTASDPDRPVRVFVYARPGHWRNCWELLEPALLAVKARFGRDVHIVTAGAWASPGQLTHGIEHLGLLDVADTGELYRSCDVGVSLTVSEHPSYLPLELMACGVPVVAFDLPAGYWILRHGENSLLARRTVESLTSRIASLVEDPGLREELGRGALASIAAAHADWDDNLAGIHSALCGPLR